MNLKELAKARGTNLKRISEQTGVPASTLYAISQGDTKFDNVGISTFIKLADALDTTVERIYELPDVKPDDVEYYIVSLDDDKGLPEFPLTDEEYELVEIYASLDERGRSMLLSAARALREG